LPWLVVSGSFCRDIKEIGDTGITGRISDK
jgi:hypothetical protein